VLEAFIDESSAAGGDDGDPRLILLTDGVDLEKAETLQLAGGSEGGDAPTASVAPACGLTGVHHQAVAFRLPSGCNEQLALSAAEPNALKCVPEAAIGCVCTRCCHPWIVARTGKPYFARANVPEACYRL
jgi:hypothetical protein